MNRTAKKLVMTPPAMTVVVGGVVFAAGFPMIGQTIVGAVFGGLLLQGLYKRTIGPVGFVVQSLVVAACVIPVAIYVTDKTSAGDELVSHEKYAATICPHYFKLNFWQKHIDADQTSAWCEDYPQYDASKSAQVAKIDGEATGSTAVTSTPSNLWK